ncbi:barstar family protein, partial [Pectinatus frisingensis]|uniref:barstar family protein n=1 Tax=Pectinatus frisingensis TaxID=865 RepID=UPI001E3BB3C5
MPDFYGMNWDAFWDAITGLGFMDDAKTHVMTIIMSKNDDTVPGIGLTQADSDSFNSNIKSFDYGESIRNNIIEEGITDMATL